MSLCGRRAGAAATDPWRPNRLCTAVEHAARDPRPATTNLPAPSGLRAPTCPAASSTSAAAAVIVAPKAARWVAGTCRGSGLRVVLQQAGDAVTGSYVNPQTGVAGTLDCTVTATFLDCEWRRDGFAGELQLKFKPGGKLFGPGYRPDGKRDRPGCCAKRAEEAEVIALEHCTLAEAAPRPRRVARALLAWTRLQQRFQTKRQARARDQVGYRLASQSYRGAPIAKHAYAPQWRYALSLTSATRWRLTH